MSLSACPSSLCGILGNASTDFYALFSLNALEMSHKV